MPKLDVRLKGMILAMAVVLGAYAALLFVTSASLISEYDSSIVGVLLVAACAFFVRRQLNAADPDNRIRFVIEFCRTRSTSTRFAGAFLLVAVSVFFDRYLDGNPTEFRLSTFVIPVMVSVLLFDLKPGLMAVALSTILVDYFLIPPIRSFEITSLPDALAIIAYVAATSLMAILLQLFISWRAPAARNVEIIAPKFPKKTTRENQNI
jgi:K+-sensing histidine kinase KdpD